MANGSNLDCFDLIVDQVKHSVITDSNPVAVVTMQLLDAGWARVVLQFEQLGGNAPMQSCRQPDKFLFSRSLENDRYAMRRGYLVFRSAR